MSNIALVNDENDEFAAVASIVAANCIAAPPLGTSKVEVTQGTAPGSCSLYFPTTPPVHTVKKGLPKGPSKRKLQSSRRTSEERMRSAAVRRLNFLEKRRQHAIETRPRIVKMR